MRGASRGVLEVEQPDRAARRTAPAFVWAGVRAFAPRNRRAAPAASPRKRRLGEPRGLTGRHDDRSARSSLGWDRARAGNTRRAQVPGSADLGFKSPARAGRRKAASKPAGGSRAGVERRKARAFRQKARASQDADPSMRLAALHPPHVAREGQLDYGVPGAAQTIRVHKRVHARLDLKYARLRCAHVTE
jgi:hypothetical protein